MTSRIKEALAPDEGQFRKETIKREGCKGGPWASEGASEGHCDGWAEKGPTSKESTKIPKILWTATSDLQ